MQKIQLNQSCQFFFLKKNPPSCKSPESDQRIKKTDVYLDYAGDFLRNIPLIWRFRGSQPNILK